MAVAAGAGLLVAGLVWSAVPAPLFTARALVGAVASAGQARLAPIAINQFSMPSVLRRIHDRLDPPALESVTDQLVGRVLSTRPGEAPGTLQVFAADVSAARATTMANLASEAIVAAQDEVAHRAQMQREAQAASRLAQADARSLAAHRRLASFGAMDADPTEALAAAQVRATNARARVATIRAIMGAGSPPLSDRSDVPAGIKTAQSTYLDAMQQMASAREALGDRHTTMLALNAQVKRAAATLTGEWRRLMEAAGNEVTISRARLAAASDAAKLTDPRQMKAAADARRDVETADAELARAKQSPEDARPDEVRYRVITPADTPAATSGVPLFIRLLLAGVSGLVAVAAGLRLSRQTGDRQETETQKGIGFDERSACLSEADEPEGLRTDAEAAVTDLSDPSADLLEASTADAAVAEPNVTPPGDRESISATDQSGQPITTIMVAANELRQRTTPVALAIGRAAASEGVRVLVVETSRAASTLAWATTSIDPIVVDLYGTLRIALPADEKGLFLIPDLDGGERIAADLTRRGETTLIDNIDEAFDLVVIDGGCATDVADTWQADVYLRVGPSLSRAADALFAATFDVPLAALLDTFVVEDETGAAGAVANDEAETEGQSDTPSKIIPLRFDWAQRYPSSRRAIVRQSAQSRRSTVRAAML